MRTACLLTALLCACVSARQEVAPPPLPAREGILLSGEVELPRLVDLCAQRLKLNIEYDSAALKGSITLRLEGPLSDDDLWRLTNQALIARGYAAVRMAGGTLISIVPIASAPAVGPWPPVDEAGGVGGVGGAGFVSEVVRLRHRPPKEIADAVARVLSKPGGSVTILSESPRPRGGGAGGGAGDGGGLILISDVAARLEGARAIVAMLDTPVAQPVMEEQPVANLSPVAMAALVLQVVSKGEVVSGVKVPGEVLASPEGGSVLIIAPAEHLGHWRTLIARLDRREGVQRIGYTPRAFGAAEVAPLIEQTIRDPADDRWRLVVDSLTGSLIMTATPSQHEAVAALIERLDSTPSAHRRPVRAFVVRHRGVHEILPIIVDLLRAGVLESGSAIEPDVVPDVDAPRMPPEARPAPSTPDAGRREVAKDSTSPDGRRSRPSPAADLTLTADGATNTLIAMGSPRMLEQLEGLIRQLDVRQPQVMLEVLLISLTDAQALDLGVELERRHQDLGGETTANLASLFGLVPRVGGVPSISGPGFTGIVLDPGDFSVVVRALQTIGDGRSLSMPRVLVGNNQRATLDSVLEQPFSSTNTSDTVSTTSFGGTLPAGTQITVRPQIAPGDYLALEYQVSLSSFTGAASNPALPPPRQQNRIQSLATIPDGHTVVVGGIELNTVGESISQVPLLGDLPWVGALFKSRSRDRSRTRFFVFIRPTILRARGFEDLKYASDLYTHDLGVDDGFPEVAPRLIPSHSPYSDGHGRPATPDARGGP